MLRTARTVLIDMIVITGSIVVVISSAITPVCASQVWDFPTCRAECHMTGHGGDVKSCDWHPTKAVLASGSKDGLVKVWDAKAGRNIATLHGHRNTVMETLWNANGNWLLSACRDQSLKVSKQAPANSQEHAQTGTRKWWGSCPNRHENAVNDLPKQTPDSSLEAAEEAGPSF